MFKNNRNFIISQSDALGNRVLGRIKKKKTIYKKLDTTLKHKNIHFKNLNTH